MARKTGLTLPDVLSLLSYAQVRKLLGPGARALLRRGGASAIDIAAQARMDREGILAECLEKTEDGGWNMTVRFRDDSAIEELAEAPAGISARSAGRREGAVPAKAQ